MPSSPDPNPFWNALSDPTRRAILDALRRGPRTTGDLASEFPELSRFAVMKHLGVLERANLVVVRRSGRERWNHLNAVPLRDMYNRWVSRLEDASASSLLALDRLAQDVSERITPPMQKTLPDTAFGVSSLVVEQEHSIPALRAVVFDLLVHQINAWWVQPYRLHDGDGQVVVDPTPGGTITEQWGDGNFETWGHMTAYRKDTLFEFAGRSGMSGAVFGFVRFSLEDDGDGTKIRLSHRALGEVSEQQQSGFDTGWNTLIGNLKACAMQAHRA